MRVFLLNSRDSDSFSFELIIPEDDFIVYRKLNGKYEAERQKDRMLLIKTLLSEMWVYNHLLTIQTGWEGSDEPVSFHEIRQGRKPHIEPYAVVPDEIVKSSWNCTCCIIERGGALLINDKNW